MRLVFISDTHNRHDELTLPDGDVLVHCGDFTDFGRMHEIVWFAQWWRSRPHKHKVIIAGNHDVGLQKNPNLYENLLTGYLRDSSVTIEGLKFYGSPWQPEFYKWAFNLPPGGEELKRRWDAIPDDTDVLVTHGPPHSVMDLSDGEPVGCKLLRDRVDAIEPKVHAFGHIHSNGKMWIPEPDTCFVNAASCGRRRGLKLARPIVVDIREGMVI